jgi:hypothetical protein
MVGRGRSYAAPHEEKPAAGGRQKDKSRNRPGERSGAPTTPGRLDWINPDRQRRGLRLSRLADLERVDAHRLGDVLELGRAEIADLEIEPRLDLPICLLGKTNGAGLANALQSRGDIDAVAHEVAVALLDHVAEMNADAKLDALLGRQAGVALDHFLLHLDRAAHRVDHAAELDDRAVAGALDDAAAMGGYRGVDEIAAQAAKTRQGTILVGAGEPAISDDISDQDRREFAGLGHDSQPPDCRLAQRTRPNRQILMCCEGG